MEVDSAENAPEPGNWEMTTPSDQLQEHQEEQQQSSENSEDTKAQKAMSALEELPKIMEELEADKTRYDLHVRLIELLKQVDMPDQLEVARENLHAIYPLSEALWLDWIKDSEQDRDKLRQLYEAASKDYLCKYLVAIPIWKSFVEFAFREFEDQWDDAERVAALRQDLLTAVAATRDHFSKSHEIWNQYIKFETDLLEASASINRGESPDPEKIKEIQRLYLNRLEALHLGICNIPMTFEAHLLTILFLMADYQNTFNQYSTFITTYDNANYEENMVKANKVFAKTKAAADDRDMFEIKLAESGYSLDMFYQYIEHEKVTELRPSLNSIRNLYERAVAIYCTDVGLWDDYICFLLERVHLPFVLLHVCERATRNCPWSGTLYAHLTRALEANGSDKETILGILDKALENEALLSSLEDLVTLFLAKCNYLRRQVDWQNPDDADIIDLRVAFEEAMAYLDEKHPTQRDPYFRIEQYYAFVEGELLDSPEKAREIWEKVVLKLGKSTDAWLAYVDFERANRNISKCESLLKRALNKKVDDPQRLMHTWLRIENELGSRDSLEDCIVRVNKKSKVLTREWQAAYAEEEARQEREKEKAIKQKQQKAQHRAKLRQKQRTSKDQPQHADEIEMQQPTTSNKRSAPDTVENDEATQTKRARLESELERPARQEMRPPRQNRILGRGAGRGGRLAGVTRKSQKDTPGIAEVNVGPSEPPAETDQKPKTQDDFRAMLLGRK
ncbi:hypothetical protein BX666DRAFT_2024808 [Dichotomocladium elegans]|nr:hypothetical protein BX666DRAFT_2024808 [Dichotomocladium elegans]